MSVFQVPEVYGQGVMPTQLPTPPKFMPSNLPGFTGQPQNQNHVASGYYHNTAPQQILMAPQMYPGFQHPGSSAESPVGIPRPSGSVTGAPSQGKICADSTTGPIATSSTTKKQTRRKFAIDLIDPKTMKNVDIYEDIVASSSTPPRSGDSSARDTPQPTTGPGAMDVAMEFAALVVKATSEKSRPPLPPT